MKRLIDIFLAIILLIIFLLPIMVISVILLTFTRSSVLYWSERVGKNNVIFKMPKFRSMLSDTPQVATDLLKNPEFYISPIGIFLRKASLDELPQIYSVLKGDMSFVGPRPALFNQKELIEMRNERGIQTLLPGITGWAQVNGRDELLLVKKVELDQEYLFKKSFLFDMKILIMTFFAVVRKEGVNF